MATLYGLLDFHEDKRLNEMFMASVFVIGSYYPETTFSKESNIDFLKEQAYELTMESYKPIEDRNRKYKESKSYESIAKQLLEDPTKDIEAIKKNALEKIESELKQKRSSIKTTLTQLVGDDKIIKAANLGSAFALDRKNSKVQDQELSGSRRLAVVASIAILPFVVMDAGKDIFRELKRSIGQLQSQTDFIQKTSEATWDVLNSKYRKSSEQGAALQAALRFSQGEDREYFNELSKKYKDEELSPQWPTKSNKPKLGL